MLFSQPTDQTRLLTPRINHYDTPQLPSNPQSSHLLLSAKLSRNSAALDSLANELETLRSHWEATNKNYRLSNAFDFEAGLSAATTKKDDRASSGLGLSESLADWRKRLDESHPESPGRK